MKNKLLLFLFAGLFLTTNIRAQLPAIPGIDFSKKDGTITDPRDNKTYVYKRYGELEWFMQNLNWDGAEGVCGPDDANGAKYGRYYKKGNINKDLCPKGWRVAQKGDWVSAIKWIADDLDLPMVERTGGNPNPQREMWPLNPNNYTIYNVGYYLRGGTAGEDGIWKLGTISDMAKDVQFNMLPSGEFNGTDGYTEGNEPGNTAWFLIGSSERYGFLTPGNSSNSENPSHNDYFNNFRHDNTREWGNVRCVRAYIDESVEVDTPYPSEIEIKQIRGVDLEKNRLVQAQLKFDQQPTGFYVYPGKKVVVNVEYLSQPTDKEKPYLIVGTLGLETSSNGTKAYTLEAGRNEFSDHAGGLIHLRYVTFQRQGNPMGKVKITFTEESEHVRAARYIYGVTTDEDFSNMLLAYGAPEVVFVSDYAVVCTSHADAITYSKGEDKKKWMDALHALIAVEDEISGLDNDDPNPLHHRHTKGEVRHLLVRNTFESPHASPDGYTGYPPGYANRFLTYEGIHGDENGRDRSWAVGHEVGHQHQQPAYMINQSGESTVNIYSYCVEREIRKEFGQDYNRTPANKWETMHKTFFKLPVEERIYNMDDEDLKAAAGGINHNEVRFMPWEQLFILFGDDFYKTLHRVTREEGIQGGTEQERRYYLIWKSSRITGYDLREFFNQWGIRLTDEEFITKMEAAFEKAKKEGTIVELPKSIADIIGVTGPNRPDWVPLQMNGITEGEEPEVDPGEKKNIALHKSVTASSYQGGNHYINVTDGSDQTRWAASDHTYPQWVEIDLEDEYALDEISIKWYNGEAGGSARSYKYKVLVSLTGEGDYQEVIDRSGNTDRGVITDELQQQTARYVRIDMSGCSYAINAGMWEVYIYGELVQTGIVTPDKSPELFTLFQDNGTLTIQLCNDEVANVTIYNVIGQKVYANWVNQTTSVALSSGIYMVRVSNGKEVEVKKVVVR